MVRALRVLSAGLLVVVLVLYGLAIYLAKGARREAIRNIACAFVLVGLVVLVVRRFAGEGVVDALVAPAGQDTGHRIWLISSSILGQIGWAAILYGVIGLLGAVFAGPTAAATSVRRRTAGVLNGRPGIVWAGVTALFLLLVAWGPTHALRTLWGVALLGALVAGGIVALRRQTLSEFPDGGSERGGTAAPALG